MDTNASIPTDAILKSDLCRGEIVTRMTGLKPAASAVVVITVNLGPEKAGGGSTPSLTHDVFKGIQAAMKVQIDTILVGRCDNCHRGPKLQNLRRDDPEGQLVVVALVFS